MMSDPNNQQQDPETRPGILPHPRERGRAWVWSVIKSNWLPLAVGGVIILILTFISVLLVFGHNGAMEATQKAADERLKAEKNGQMPFNPNERMGAVPLPGVMIPNQPPQPASTGTPQQQQAKKTTTGEQDEARKRIEDFWWKARFRSPDYRPTSDTSVRSTGASPHPEQDPEQQARREQEPAHTGTPLSQTQAPELPSTKQSNDKDDDNAQHEDPWDVADGDRYLVMAETTQITGRLLTAINADNAGPVLVQITEPVWNHEMTEILVPKGTYCSGSYDRVSEQDQERVMLAIHMLQMPDGWRVHFPKAEILDRSGGAGLHDKVNHHYVQIFLTSIGIAGAGAGASFSSGGSGYGFSPVSAMRIGFSEGTSEASMQVLSRFARRKPTITIRAGQEINFFLPVDGLYPAYRNHHVRRNL